MRTFITIILLILVVVGGILTYQRWQALNSFDKPQGNSIVFGNPHGTVTIVEYLDFTCPHCPVVHKVLWEAMKGDTRVKLIMRPFPLLGGNSEPIARMVFAASKQGKMEEFAKVLLANHQNLDMVTIRTYAAQVGLDILQLEADVEESDVRGTVAAAIGSARAMGIAAVPTYYFNGKKFMPEEGVPTVGDFKHMINEAERRTLDETE
ncbi:MAG: thioredoxin domain-containing protein [Alphaproteobacteria bacterium]|nr:thioredoxin domain-containing protein [Alphaproteobacteria bacterium]